MFAIMGLSPGEVPVHRFRRLLAALLLALAFAWTPGRPQAAHGVDRKRPVTALVLSGGGARGAAHVGVLRVLEELQVPVDLVVGTSMGAVVGGFYASGLPPERIEQDLLSVDWRELFNDRPYRKHIPFRRKQDDADPFFDFEMGIKKGLHFQSGLIAGQKLGFLLQTSTLHTAGLEAFDDLPLPFRAVATDLRTGKVVPLEHGDLGTAVRASMAVPAVFTPVEIDGRMLVDGGVVRNIPVDVAHQLGAERIIAVDVTTKLDDLSKMSMFSVASQSIAIYSEGNEREQLALLGEGDLSITPDLQGITSSSFEEKKLREAIQRGVDAARQSANRLRGFSVSDREFEAYLSRQRRDPLKLAVDRTIDRIRVEGHRRVAARQIVARIRTLPGEELDLERLQRDLERIYEIGEFQHVAFRLERPGGQTELVIDVEEKYWGPNYLRFGLALSSNFEGSGEFATLAQILRTQINGRGAEWKNRVSIGSQDRLLSEYYQPLDYRGFFFVAPSLEYIDTEVSALSAGNELERVRIDFLAGRLDVGMQFGNVGELRVGATRGSAHVDVLTLSTVPPMDFEIGGWTSSLAIDRLDNANFPRAGSVLDAELFFSRESLGADTDYDTLGLFLLGAQSYGKNTLLGWVDAQSNLGSEITFFERVELGGFLNLSGADPGTLLGNVGGTLAAVYYREVSRMLPTVGRGIYVGGSLEAGGAWERSADARLSDTTLAGSLFLGADTKFGPLYLGYGRTEDGDDAFYFFLGRLFSQR
jgi:NTE family protein